MPTSSGFVTHCIAYTMTNVKQTHYRRSVRSGGPAGSARRSGPLRPGTSSTSRIPVAEHEVVPVEAGCHHGGDQAPRAVGRRALPPVGRDVELRLLTGLHIRADHHLVVPRRPGRSAASAAANPSGGNRSRRLQPVHRREVVADQHEQDRGCAATGEGPAEQPALQRQQLEIECCCQGLPGGDLVRPARSAVGRVGRRGIVSRPAPGPPPAPRPGPRRTARNRSSVRRGRPRRRQGRAGRARRAR